MINNESAAKLEKLTEEILQKMTFADFKIVTKIEAGKEEESFYINIETPESNLLIGQHGATLKALQHVIRVMARRVMNEKVRFLLDVNNYLRQKTSSLSELVRNAAEKVLSEKKPIVLRPMSAYERRLVHLELAGNENIRTESVGEGDERKVVIRPVGELEKLEKEQG